MDVKETASKYADYQVEMRRYFHQNPELSEQEFNTSRKVKEELDKIGVSWRPCGLETGVLAEIKGSKPGKTILIRGDMDALSVHEETGLPYASRNEGVMHACGHDCHVSMLLTAAHILNDMKDELCGTVRLAFQPAEEVAKGARSMIEQGAMDGVDGCFCIHVWGGVDAGAVTCDAGPRMAAARKFTIDVTGKGGHGAQPQACVDAIVTGAAIVSSLQTIVSRETAATDPAVVTVGEFNAGERWNVIAEKAHLAGTTRCFSNETFENLPAMIRRIAEDTAAAYRAEVEVEDIVLVPPVNNDTNMAMLGREAAVKVIGPDSPVDVPKTMGGEDFAFFMEKAPGAAMMLGSGCPYVNHHNKFACDESVLIKGAAIYAQVAMDFNAQKQE